MDYNQIMTIVLGAIGTAGGAATVISLGLGILKTVSTSRHTRALNKNTKAIDEQTGKIIDALRNELDCTLDVDVTAKIAPVVDELREQAVLQIKQQNEQLYAIKSLIIEDTKMLTDSPRVSRDEKERLIKLVDSCNALVVKDKPDTNKVVIKLTEAKNTIKDVVDIVKPIADAVISAVQV